ncbi:hypothetical protein T439DRAFT_378854 [Meredithblackwellia eburnea MCA 4105]
MRRGSPGPPMVVIPVKNNQKGKHRAETKVSRRKIPPSDEDDASSSSPSSEEEASEEEDDDSTASGIYMVKRILNEKVDKHSNELQYLIRWKGYTSADDTWEPAQNMREDVPDLVERYLKAKKKRFDKEKRRDESRRTKERADQDSTYSISVAGDDDQPLASTSRRILNSLPAQIADKRDKVEATLVKSSKKTFLRSNKSKKDTTTAKEDVRPSQKKRKIAESESESEETPPSRKRSVAEGPSRITASKSAPVKLASKSAPVKPASNQSDIQQPNISSQIAGLRSFKRNKSVTIEADQVQNSPPKVLKAAISTTLATSTSKAADIAKVSSSASTPSSATPASTSATADQATVDLLPVASTSTSQPRPLSPPAITVPLGTVSQPDTSLAKPSPPLNGHASNGMKVRRISGPFSTKVFAPVDGSSSKESSVTEDPRLSKENLLATSEKRLRRSKFYELWRETFDELELTQACTVALQLDPSIAVAVQGRCCSVINAGGIQGDQVGGESWALAVVLESLGSKQATQLDEIDVVFFHRTEGAFQTLHSSMINILSRIPRVSFYAFGAGHPVTPFFCFGMMVVPLFEALADAEGTEAFIRLRDRMATVTVRVHPTTMNLNSGKGPVQDGVAKYFEDGSAELVAQEELPRQMSEESPVAESNRELYEVGTYLSHLRKSHPHNFRRFIIVGTISDTFTEKKALYAQSGIEYLSWDEVTALVVHSKF